MQVFLNELGESLPRSLSQFVFYILFNSIFVRGCRHILLLLLRLKRTLFCMRKFVKRTLTMYTAFSMLLTLQPQKLSNRTCYIYLLIIFEKSFYTFFTTLNDVYFALYF